MSTGHRFEPVTPARCAFWDEDTETRCGQPLEAHAGDIFCTGCDRLVEYGHAEDCPRDPPLARGPNHAEGSKVNEPALFTAAEVARMLEGIRRSIEVMGEDGECSLRTINGVQYVTKDDATSAVDDRLGVVRLRALADRSLT